jgi:hypothetical protein
MKYLFILLLFVIMGCDIVMVVKPDLVKDGKEYVVNTVCIQSHTEYKYEYHYGYNFMSSKYEWHWGMNDKSICDKIRFDTIEVNLRKKYYTKK